MGVTGLKSLQLLLESLSERAACSCIFTKSVKAVAYIGIEVKIISNHIFISLNMKIELI